MKYNIKQITLFFLLTIWTAVGYAQISSVISKRNIEIGETVELKLKAKLNDSLGIEIEQEELHPNLEYLSESNWIKEGGFFEKKWELVAWDSGQYIIPEIEVKINNKKGFKTNTHLLLVGDISLPDSTALEDIKPIIEEEATIEDYLNIVYLILGILFLLGLVYYVYKQNKKQDDIIDPSYEELIRPAHIIAAESLEKLDKLDHLSKGEEKEYQSALSLILRRYLDQRFGSSLLEKTTSQILLQLDKLNDIPKEIRERLKDQLPQSDLIKYAGQRMGLHFNAEVRQTIDELINKTTSKEEQKYKLQEKDALLQEAIESGLRRTVSLGAVPQLNKLLLQSTHYGTASKREKLYRWTWTMPFQKVELASIELPDPIIEWHKKGLGSFNALYNTIGSKLAQSGLLGSSLLLLLNVLLLICIPACALIDIVKGRKIFGKGNIELEENGKIRFMYSIVELEKTEQ